MCAQVRIPSCSAFKVTSPIHQSMQCLQHLSDESHHHHTCLTGKIAQGGVVKKGRNVQLSGAFYLFVFLYISPFLQRAQSSIYNPFLQHILLTTLSGRFG